LSAVLHYLRTPLTAIHGLAETLEREADLSEGDRTQLAAEIRHQAEGMHRMVTNLLDVARMQKAGARLNREWHSLGEIVAALFAGWARHCEVRLRACVITQDKRNDSVRFVLANDHVECEVRLGVHYLPVTQR